MIKQALCNLACSAIIPVKNRQGSPLLETNHAKTAEKVAKFVYDSPDDGLDDALLPLFFSTYL
ncbi:MAG: hypothetical protein RLZZ225_448 [Pseudomonadota bacterium]